MKALKLMSCTVYDSEKNDFNVQTSRWHVGMVGKFDFCVSAIPRDAFDIWRGIFGRSIFCATAEKTEKLKATFLIVEAGDGEAMNACNGDDKAIFRVPATLSMIKTVEQQPRAAWNFCWNNLFAWAKFNLVS